MFGEMYGNILYYIDALSYTYGYGYALFLFVVAFVPPHSIRLSRLCFVFYFLCAPQFVDSRKKKTETISESHIRQFRFSGSHSSLRGK